MHDLRILEIAERQHGVVGRDQLTQLGVSRTARARLTSSGHWMPVTPRVLRRTGAPVTANQGAMAAVLDVGPGAVLSHGSAAALWGLPGYQLLPAVVSRVMSHSSDRLATVHAIRALPPRWVTSLEGIPVVRPELCVMQLCATVHAGRAERALDTAWSLRLLSGASLARLLVDLGERGRNGVAVLRELLVDRGPTYVPPASNLESRFQKILKDAGLPEMRRQIDSGSTSWTGRVDFRAVDAALIIEVQSERYHSALVDVVSDIRRREQLESDGFTVLEVTDDEIWQWPAIVVQRIRRALLGGSHSSSVLSHE